MIKILLSCLLLQIFLNSCVKKVPFTEDYGWISFTSSHWFENEQVAYLFFEISELPERLLDPAYQLSYTWTNQAGGTETKDYADIDFSSAVHQHQLVKCGTKKTCGSFTWKIDGPLESVDFRFRYDKQNDLYLNSYSIAIQNHTFSIGNSNSFSAIPYGVFNESNDRVQFRVFNNFGSPTSSDITRYGMTRNFNITDSYLDNSQAIADLSEQIESSGYVFPADFCSQRAEGTRTNIATVKKQNYWLDGIFDATQPDIGACLRVDFLDQQDQKLTSAVGFGLRNPIVAANNMKLQTPLRKLIQIPVIVEPCDGPFSAQLRDNDYLKYQKFILGLGNRPVDICFDIDKPDQYREDFKNHLQTRLTETKQSNGLDNDYIFVVILHEKLSREFHHIHSATADELYRLSLSEADFNTPKLVGAMVYGSTAEYEPTLIQKKFLMWCPQNAPTQISEGELLISTPNCTISKGSELKILGINFVAPMGPFPDLDNYIDYTEKYGDTGLAKSPRLVLQSVPSGTNTIVENRKQVTYFDNVRLTLATGEAVKVCFEKTNPYNLYNLRFKPDSFAADDEGLDIFDIQEIWDSELYEGDYRIGISWEFPFWGGVSYKSNIAVDVVAVIPFYKDFNQYESLGDDIWKFSEWPVGEYLNHCRKYCEHPFFDVNGAYRNSSSWKKDSNNLCTKLKIPEWAQEDSQ